ncbi:sn-glycerol-3-phosphate ABC transporter ATP-binding protein UgpC [Anaerolineales bacterium HSG25]|nr:sn-glycerol-3-phosphate ABC transporter ATP-binding protein UgpC [Anaerolineales bacterium HSG25]
MAGIEFKDMLKQWGDVIGVNHLSLQVPDKEFLVLVGPSGCGKSTALRCLAGLEEISGGEIWIGDRMVNDIPPKDRDIAMVFQSYALYPHMSVYDNMAFGLKLRKTPKDEIDRRVQEAASVLQIQNLLDRKPKAMSGGQRQRVAMGRAIVRNPAVFLFDEPLSNLDAKLRVETRAQISKLHQRLGTTFVYVTHDQVEALTMADRICVLKLGLLQQVDSPSNLYNHPVNVFVAGFIGSPSMNFFSGTITGDTNEMYADSGSVRLRLPQYQIEQLGQKSVGRKIIFGMRPEDIHHPQYKPTSFNEQLVEATVDVTELMGNEIFVYLQASEHTLIARVDPRADMRPGDKVKMAFNSDKIHIFDQETEKTLSKIKA